MNTISATADRVESFLEMLAYEAFSSFGALNDPSFTDAEVKVPSRAQAPKTIHLETAASIGSLRLRSL